MKKIINFLDEHLLFALTGFLLAFIPLYPKLPLFDIIPGYIVRVRLEDFFVGFALIVWLIQLYRKKIQFGPNPLAKPILTYLVFGVLSMLSAVFILHTVPLESIHVNKMVLHFLRRIEYFSLFFVFFSTIKNMKQVKIYILIVVLTMLGVTLYGYGQKYLYWPAFSTMNREFSKGWRLYLTPNARVMSTFGGHYDLAAFTMMFLASLWSLFFGVRTWIFKAAVFLVLMGAYWLLILTVSRASFLAYLGALFIVFAMWSFKNGVKWAALRYVSVTFLTIVIMLSFGSLGERFTRLLKIDRRIEGIKSLVSRPWADPPTDKALFLENNLAAVTSPSDTPPIPTRPSDVTEDIPEGFIASQSATGEATESAIARTYSKNAMIYDLSTSIRLDALWPRAIAGFLRNPLLGSGYSTLTKTQPTEFTEAESTDNDFLRALGETGALGFLAFFGTLAFIVWKIARSFTRINDVVFCSFLIGFTAGLIGLLINAVYIDVFEASKVAFSFWALTGIALGGIKVMGADFAKKERLPEIGGAGAFAQKILSRALFFIKGNTFPLIILLFFSFYVRTYRIDNPIADWHSWRQADTAAVTRNFVRSGINLLYPTYDDLSSIPSGLPNPQGYRMVEFPLYNFAATVIDKIAALPSVEHSGRVTSILFSLGTLIFLYKLATIYFGKKTAMLTGLFFAILPYNIYYSRVILPEPALVFFSTGMLYFFDRWIAESKKRSYLFSLLFGMCAFLIKVSSFFLIFPMLYLAFRKWRFGMVKNIWLYIYAVLLIAPFVAWRVWISQFPEGIPAFTWLLNGNGIRFKGAFFWWLFEERIGRLILGVWGVPLLILGLLLSPGKKEGWIFHWWIFGMIAYLIVFATGNVQHDYYQVILIPILAIFLGKGVAFLIELKNSFSPMRVRLVTTGVLVLFMLAFGWYQIRDFFNINHPEIVEAGAEFDRLGISDKARVIAPYDGDTAFLYQTRHTGWPIMEGSIDDMIRKGAHYYLSVRDDVLTQEIIAEARNPKGSTKGFKVIKETPQFVIVQLVSDKQIPH